MKDEQLQPIDTMIKEVCHTLANVLVTTALTNGQFDTLPPEAKAMLETQWRTLHVKAIQDLQTSLILLKTNIPT